MAALFVLPLISGCAAGSAPGWNQDKPLITAAIQEGSQRQQQQDEKLAILEQRLSALEQQAARQEATIRALTASVEAANAGGKRKTVRALPIHDKKLAEKIRKVESALQQAEPAAPAVDPNEEKNSYTAAYLALKSGRYDEAAADFKALIDKFPKGEYADQALYWLGESHLAQKRLDDAIKAFKKVVNNYPKSAKHPVAILKLGIAYQQAKRIGDAKAAFQMLIDQHPDAPAAQDARERLQLLSQGK